MNFSERIRISSNHFSWSPNGKFCASAITARLEIREGYELQLHCTFNCLNNIQVIEWSPDSTLILTANYKNAIIEVWQPLNIGWKCRIDEGVSGLTRLCWTPDSRHILAIADFHLKVTVWSLVTKSVTYIKSPKDISNGIQFTTDGEYAAVAERKDCRDCICIIETKSWHLVKEFDVTTRDMAGLCWASDNSVMAVFDCPVEYKVLIYNTTGQCLASYQAYQWALGVKSIAWSPSSQFLAISSYDDKVRLMNNITWKITSEFSHDTLLHSKRCVVWKETEKTITGFQSSKNNQGQGLQLTLESSYEEETARPISLTNLPIDYSKPLNTKHNSTLLFNRDGRYLATRVDSMPSVVWIWSVAKLNLCVVLVHTQSVKDMSWSVKENTLAMCTSSSHVYMWSPFGCVSVCIPLALHMQLNALRWHPCHNKLAALAKDNVTVLSMGEGDQRRKKDVI